MNNEDSDQKKSKIYPISMLLGLISVAVIAISIAQWFFRFPDPSQLFLGVFTGLSLLLGAYFYNWAKNKDEQDIERDKAIGELSVV